MVYLENIVLSSDHKYTSSPMNVQHSFLEEYLLVCDRILEVIWRK